MDDEEEIRWEVVASDLMANLAICGMVIAAVVMCSNVAAKAADMVQAGQRRGAGATAMVHLVLKSDGTTTTTKGQTPDMNQMKGQPVTLHVAGNHADNSSYAKAIERAVAAIYVSGAGPVAFTTNPPPKR